MSRTDKSYMPKYTASLSIAERRVLDVISSGEQVSNKEIARKAGIDMESNYVNNCLTKLKRWGIISNFWRVKPLETVKYVYCLECRTICNLSEVPKRRCACQSAIPCWVPVEIQIAINYAELGNKEVPLDTK